MFTLVISYFFVEIFVGFMYKSLALVADACHMLSDGLCLVIAFIAIQVSKRSSDKRVLKEMNTFGWGRAEVLGALINAVFLLALCVIIILESIQKFIQPEPVEKPLTVCIVGAIGLLMNILGLIIFQGDSGAMHGHSHGDGGHGHSHDNSHGHSHGHSHESESNTNGQSKINSQSDCESKHSESQSNHENDFDDHEKSKGRDHSHDIEKQKSQAEQLNMKGIFLHVLGDAVGSVVVIISAILMYFFNNCDDADDNDSVKCALHSTASECGDFLTDNNIDQGNMTAFINQQPGVDTEMVTLMYPGIDTHWTLYVDPVTSIVLTALILYTTLGLLKVPIMILLQTVPRSIDLEKLEDELITVSRRDYETEINIHHLHVWTLSGNKVVGTVHIKLFNVELEKFNLIVTKAREIFHNYGIHYLTIQPEFSTVRTESLESISELSTQDSEKCLLVCCGEADGNKLTGK